MSFVYTEAKRRFGVGGILLEGTDDIRVALLLNTTTADTEEDVTNLAAFTTLGEVTDGSYSRKALVGETFAADNVNNLGKFTSTTPVTWTALTTAGTVQAALLYKHVAGGDANCIPIAFIDSGGFPFSLSGATFNINMAASGWLAIT